MSKRTDRKIQQAIGRVLLRIDASIKRQTAEQQRAANNAAEQLRQIAASISAGTRRTARGRYIVVDQHLQIAPMRLLHTRRSAATGSLRRGA